MFSSLLAHLALCVLLLPALAGAADDLGERLALVRRLAGEADDRALIARADRLAASGRGGGAEAVGELAELEAELGIDPGGWSMGGLLLFRPAAGDAAVRVGLERDLLAALTARDAAAVAAVVERCRGMLGDRAGIPDVRRRGWRPPADAGPGAPPELARLCDKFAKPSPLRQALLARRPQPGTMVRVYAGAVTMLCTLRPAVAARLPDRLAQLDALLDGAAGILIDLQRGEGHWPFPDLRGRHLRFGGMIERELTAGDNRVEDGWLVAPGRNGESFFDTGLAGQALLRAATARGVPAWREAALRAARWCAATPLSTNWNYNAFAIALCADAGLIEEAVAMAGAGLLPGQLTDGPSRGRWLDAHNARSVYHAIMLRCLHDLLATLPAAHPRRAIVAAAARLAVTAIADEQDAAGVTVICLRELARHAELAGGADPRLAAVAAAQRQAIAANLRGERAPGADLAELAWWAVQPPAAPYTR